MASSVSIDDAILIAEQCAQHATPPIVGVVIVALVEEIQRLRAEQRHDSD